MCICVAHTDADAALASCKAEIDEVEEDDEEDSDDDSVPELADAEGGACSWPTCGHTGADRTRQALASALSCAAAGAPRAPAVAVPAGADGGACDLFTPHRQAMPPARPSRAAARRRAARRCRSWA